MCNRANASLDYPETKIRWNLFKDRESKPSHNIAPDLATYTRSLPLSDKVLPHITETHRLSYPISPFHHGGRRLLSEYYDLIFPSLGNSYGKQG
jgi:hypothetical protein